MHDAVGSNGGDVVTIAELQYLNFLEFTNRPKMYFEFLLSNPSLEFSHAQVEIYLSHSPVFIFFLCSDDTAYICLFHPDLNFVWFWTDVLHSRTLGE